MTTINIYMIFDGNCQEAFLFYQSVFGGEWVTNSVSNGWSALPHYNKNDLSNCHF
jgi:uncharacterized glyoxalase superfamily protein PhnB